MSNIPSKKGPSYIKPLSPDSIAAKLGFKRVEDDHRIRRLVADLLGKNVDELSKAFDSLMKDNLINNLDSGEKMAKVILEDFPNLEEDRKANAYQVLSGLIYYRLIGLDVGGEIAKSIVKDLPNCKKDIKTVAYALLLNLRVLKLISFDVGEKIGKTILEDFPNLEGDSRVDAYKILSQFAENKSMSLDLGEEIAKMILRDFPNLEGDSRMYAYFVLSGLTEDKLISFDVGEEIGKKMLESLPNLLEESRARQSVYRTLAVLAKNRLVGLDVSRKIAETILKNVRSMTMADSFLRFLCYNAFEELIMNQLIDRRIATMIAEAMARDLPNLEQVQSQTTAYEVLGLLVKDAWIDQGAKKRVARAVCESLPGLSFNLLEKAYWVMDECNS